MHMHPPQPENALLLVLGSYILLPQAYYAIRLQIFALRLEQTHTRFNGINSRLFPVPMSNFRVRVLPASGFARRAKAQKLEGPRYLWTYPPANFFPLPLSPFTFSRGKILSLK